MAGPIWYSTNPWVSEQIGATYRRNVHFAWCSEHFDPHAQASLSSAALMGYTSSPVQIYEQLHLSVKKEDVHCALIRRYKRTFRSLASNWLNTGSISAIDYDEIIASIKKPGWRIWRPVLYVIERAPIERAGRLVAVPASNRAAYGMEYQIHDLRRSEFDMIELRPI